jgi:hypothetical protein
MKIVIATAALALLTLSSASADNRRGQERKGRPFLMGVTAMPYDVSAEAIEATQNFIIENTDMVAIKFDEGIPWEEAFQNRNAYTPGFEKSFTDKSKFPKEKKVFLSVTPLNKDKNAMAGYRDDGENSPNPDPWGRKDFDDAMVAKAYLNFCKEMIRRFRPDYFAYAMDVNTLAKTPAKWKKFIPFVRDIYIALKKDNPQLPLILTFSTEGVFWDQDQAPAQRKAIQEVVPFTDLMAVTALPYVKEQNPAKIGKNYFQQMAALAPNKPFAIAETAFLAEDVNFIGIERVGKAAWQQDYLRFCFEEGVKLNAKFIVWMVPRDPDMLAEKVPPPLNEFFKLFKDTGLLDGEGKPRKSFELWSQWLKYTRVGK